MDFITIRAEWKGWKSCLLSDYFLVMLKDLCSSSCFPPSSKVWCIECTSNTVWPKDKPVSKRWWCRGEKGRLWTHFLGCSSRQQHVGLFALGLWKKWKLTLRLWTCPLTGDCRPPPWCCGSSPSSPWVSAGDRTETGKDRKSAAEGEKYYFGLILTSFVGSVEI